MNTKYLDERIVITVNGIQGVTIDGTFRYDVLFGGRLQFIGNCFIAKELTQKSIDITEIVRTHYDIEYPFKDVDLTEQWQIAITVNNNTFYSEMYTIYPIYRYPNRKAEMETDLEQELTPMLQGAPQLPLTPHIPYCYSDIAGLDVVAKMDREMGAYLWSGVKKAMNQGNQSVKNTTYSFHDLFTGHDNTLDWDLTSLNDIDIYENAAKDPEKFPVDTSTLVNEQSLEPTKESTCDLYACFPLTYNGYINHAPREIKFNNKSYRVDKFPLHMDLKADNDYCDLVLDNVEVHPSLNRYTTINATLDVTPAFTNDTSLFTQCNGTKMDYDFHYNQQSEFVKVTLIDNNAQPTNINVYDGQVLFFPDRYKMMKLNTEDGTAIDTIVLSDICSLDNGYEYAIAFDLRQNIVITPKQVSFRYELYFTNERAVSNPEDVYIRTAGKQTIANSDTIRISKTNLDFEVIYGNEQAPFFDSYGINFYQQKNSIFQLTVVGKDNQIIKQKMLIGGVNELFSLPYSGDYTMYISEARKDGTYNIYKLNTKGLALSRGISAYIGSQSKYVVLTNFISVPKDSPKYKQYENSRKNILIAKTDDCPARYYLQWRDRYGSTQMQPFEKTETFSEDLERTEIRGFYNTRRLSQISVQPKWTLHTAWVPFEQIPYYESLLVSPWVRLYDTKEDHLYDVILKDKSFTEKTFRNNDMQLWHMQVEVEQISKQDIIY